MPEPQTDYNSVQRLNRIQASMKKEFHQKN